MSNVPTKAASQDVAFVRLRSLGGRQFRQRAVDLDYLVEEGVIDPEDRELLWFAETAREIWDGILGWYEAAGEPLCAAT